MRNRLLRRRGKPLDLVAALIVVLLTVAANGCSGASATIGPPPNDGGAPSDGSTGTNNPSDGGCTQTVPCMPPAHWDPTQCACVIDGGGPLPDGSPGDSTRGEADACVDNVLCIATDHWDPVLCECVPNDGGLDSSLAEGGDGGQPDATDAGSDGCAQIAPCAVGFKWDLGRCACVGAGQCISGQGGHCLGFTAKPCTCMVGLTCHLARIPDLGGTCEP
jgi:hypothetical protein